jgi:hypothetical protein
MMGIFTRGEERFRDMIDEVLYIKCGLFGSAVKPEEKADICAWVDRVVENLK